MLVIELRIKLLRTYNASLFKYTRGMLLKFILYVTRFLGVIN